MLYILHPLLNLIVLRCNKFQLSLICFVLFLIYFFLASIIHGILFYSRLCYVITIYLIIAMLRKYEKNILKERNKMVILVIGGSMIIIALHLLVNELGFHIEFFNNKLSYFVVENNPLLLIIAIGLFGIFSSFFFINMNIPVW